MDFWNRMPGETSDGLASHPGSWDGGVEGWGGGTVRCFLRLDRQCLPSHPPMCVNGEPQCWGKTNDGPASRPGSWGRGCGRMERVDSLSPHRCINGYRKQSAEWKPVTYRHPVQLVRRGWGRRRLKEEGVAIPLRSWFSRNLAISGFVGTLWRECFFSHQAL